jgi:hypothetical protein
MGPGTRSGAAHTDPALTAKTAPTINPNSVFIFIVFSFFDFLNGENCLPTPLFSFPVKRALGRKPPFADLIWHQISNLRWFANRGSP